MDGWAALAHEVDRATSYEQIEQAAERVRRLMGESTAQVLVMLVTAAVAGGAAKFAAKLPKLPGFGRAAEWAEVQGLKLARAGISPSRTPSGDALQAAAKRIAQNWSRSELRHEQARAIAEARRQGKYLEVHLMERRFRGQWVERELRDAFKELRWSHRGVDAVDPSTGLRYEILAGTDSNMALHGRRMVEELFLLITF